jgi:translocation and assembly module TamB
MRTDGAIDGRATLVLRRATYRGSALPAASATVAFGRPAASTFRGHADVSIEEPEAPIQIALVFDPREGSPVLTFVADAHARELASVPQLRGVIAGGVDVHANGSLFMGSASIDATVSAVATGLRANGVSIAHARLEAHAIGRWAAPVANVEIEGETVDATPLQLSAFRAQGRVSFEGVPVMRDLTLDAAGDAAPIRARVGLLRIDSAGLQVDDARVEGLGEPVAGSARVSSSSMTVVAQGKRIDLVRIGSFVTLPLRAGSVAIDVDASTTARSAEGHLALDLTHGAIGNLRDANGHLEATVHGRRVSARATLNADDLATVQLTSSVLEIGDGPLLSAGPWRQAWGRVDLDGHADLAKLAGRLPVGTLPLADLRGMLRIHAALGRDSLVDMTPEVDATITTDGLVIAGTRGSGAWRLDGLNPSLHISVNGDTGATLLTGQVADGKGPLLVLSAASKAVPYSALFSDMDVTGALVSTPFDAKVEMPQRRLDTLPAALGTRKFRGTLRGEVLWTGSLRQPTVTVDASFDRGHAEPQLIGLPVDVTAHARYDGVRLEIAAHGSQKGKSMVDATAVVSAAAHDWLSGNHRWTASTRVKLIEFPLRSFEALDDRQVRGNLSGELSLDGLNEQASAKAELHFDGVHVGEVACRTANVSASLDGHTLDVQAALEQTDGGTIASHLRVGSRWGAKITPELDPTSLAQISLKAKRFRAAMLLPFLSGTLSQLDGRIDGDAGLELDPIHQSARPNGALTFEGGTFELGSMGSEFRDAQARVTFSPNGVVHLQDARARGPSGRLEASGTAWLAGLGFGGASAMLRVPAADPLPLVVDGVQLGKIDGRIDVTMTRSQRQIDLDVSVPAARIELPSTSDSRDVEDLGDIDGVRVGMAARDRTFIEVPLDASSDETGPDVRSNRRATGTPTKIDVRLGQDVRVLRGNTLDVRLLGQPTIVIDRDVRVSGQVRLARGSVDVQGKPFELEPGGTVTFVGSDATNPQVVLSAHWTAPDSTKIYASFTGPLKTGKITLRSEPARSQNEILALILFGTSDQASTGSVPETTSMAAAAGGAATQPLNQALGGVNHALDKLGLAAGISTKVDTSTPNPRPEVELQIARDISLQVAWVLGLPPASSPDTTLVTLDWRFLKKWSLETTVGDMGTSILDVVWQHRY